MIESKLKFSIEILSLQFIVLKVSKGTSIESKLKSIEILT